MALPSYVQLPLAARPIPVPASAAQPAARPTTAPFPPPPAAPPTRKFAVPTTASLSSNVSDLVLSSLLPANLPKPPSSHAPPGRALELTSQREELALSIMSNNFRRFVTKVGPIFWLQDRVEEVLFWQKPVWTWAWIALWVLISFNPRALLCLPSAALLVLFTGLQERKAPVPSLFGVVTQPTAMGSVRMAPGDPAAFSASTAPESEGAPVVAPKEAESSVDYYMNIQAIQNLMGLIADGFDVVLPYLAILSGKDKSPTTFPLSQTHIILALVPPTLLLPLTPTWAIPYLLLPMGIAPPMLFHPNVAPLLHSLPRSRAALKARANLEDLALSDSLPDDLGQRTIRRVEVFENERLDPAVAAKNPSPAPAGSWSARFLKAGERAPWVKVCSRESVWADEEPAPASDERMALALRDNWAFVPGEDWRVDVCGLWSAVGTDAEGWAYSDDSWLGPASRGDEGNKSAAKKVTRRRRWYRRVYE